MISEELLQSFIAEASDLLDDAESSLVDYSRCSTEEEQTEIVNRVFRHFHSIKGSAGFVGLHDIALLTHEAETLLEQYRKDPERLIPQEDINLLCRTVDLLRAIFATGGADEDEEGNDLGLDSLIQEIKAATQKAKKSTSAPLLSESFPNSADTRESGDNAAQPEIGDQKYVDSVIAGKDTDNNDTGNPSETNPPRETAKLSTPQDEASTSPTTDVADREPSAASVVDDAESGAENAAPKKSSDTDIVNSHKKTTSTRRLTSNTANIIKGVQLSKRDKLSASDFAERYVAEANELLEQIEQSLLHAEQHPDSSADAVQEALRCLHSFKGNSGFMNLVDLERLSHRMEAEVENHIDRTLGLDTQTFDALLQMIDVLRQGVHDFAIGGSGRIPEADAYIEMMDEFSQDRLGTRYHRSRTTNVPAERSDQTSSAAEKKGDAATAVNDAGDAASPKKSGDDEQPERRRPDDDTRMFQRQTKTSSDTTRMVLMGSSNAQVNLADAPRSKNIIVANDKEAADKPFWSPLADSGQTKNQPEEKTTPETQPSAKSSLTTKKLSETTNKRRNQDQLTARNDIRVDLRKLDSILDLVGELVIAEAMVTRHPVVWNAENESLERAVHQLRRVASSLQDMATSVRMIPLAQTFRRMTRLVYDLSVKAGKQVDLVLLGEDTEVDRTVIERISDPLVHIIRNAIDHGIEAPELRRLAGKPEAGRLTIEGHHEGGEVWIIVTDDGRGLDRNAILSRAIVRGLVSGDGSDLSDREIYHFIFEPGFSTANRVTDISGRGFGMDVVKKNIEKLSGRIDIQTRPGEGTAVVMRIPLTLAIIDGMLVSSGENRYIIPLLSIRESLRPEPDHIVTTPDGQDVLKLRGELIPIVKLGETFSRASNAKTLYDGILMIVEGEDGDVVALFADELVGQQETVIKGLSGWLKKSRGVSGCTILGDGEVGLILDIGAIVRMARGASPGLTHIQ